MIDTPPENPLSLRVCQIGTTAFPSTKCQNRAIGGIPGYIYDLLQGLLIEGIYVDFVGKIYNYDKRDYLTYHETQRDVKTTHGFLIALLMQSIIISLNERTIIHAHRPDHLAVFSLFKKNPALVTLHGQQSITINKRKNLLIRAIYSFLEKIALKKALRILATDLITYKYYCNAYPAFADKIDIIPTGVNMSLFRPLDKYTCRSKHQLSGSAKIILYLGRVEPPKKVEEIIKAFEKLYHANPNYILLIIGDGKQLQEMIGLTRKLSISDAVLFFGARMREELPELINCADISVLYSGNEGSPLSVKESLACGVPVVANRVGDIDAIITNGKNGYIVYNESIDTLASAIKKCLSEADLMKEFCVRSCEMYSTSLIHHKIINIYKEIQNV